jgi:hypothetical protein
MKNTARKIYTLLILMPVSAMAFTLTGSTIYDVIGELNSTVNIILPILFTLSFIAFFWGLSKFILNSSSSAEVEKGRKYMIWGIIALFVLISVRTIIVLIANDLGIGNSSVIPFIPTSISGTYNNTNGNINLPQGLPKP